MLSGDLRLQLPGAKTGRECERVHEGNLSGGYFGLRSVWLKVVLPNKQAHHLTNILRYTGICFVCRTIERESPSRLLF